MKNGDKLIPLLKALRNHAEKQKGFISRKTYTSLSNPGESIVISKWKTAGAWEKWMAKEKTKKLQGKVDSLIGEKTIYDIYQPETY